MRSALGTAGIAAAAALLASVLTLWATGRRPEGPAAAESAAATCPTCPPQHVRMMKPLRPVEFSADFYGLEYRGNSAHYVDLQILMFGAFEKPILHFMRDTMQSLAPEGGVFVDVGANTGQHSLFMSKFSREVHAFEPYPPVLARFRSMVEANGIENIRVYAVGLGAEQASVPFYEPPPSNPAMGSFVEGFKQENQLLGEFPIVVGDEILRESGVSHVDLAKVDVEGYEKPVLRGLRDTLEASRPVVVMEITIDPDLEHLFRSREDLVGALPSAYECLAFVEEERRRATGRYALRPCQLDFAHEGQQDLVLYPTEKREHVRRRAPPREPDRAGK